ncbi:gamma carbonic anhydrase family protein [Butyrivibrio sp. VCB2006]|uniref:gamma carbonic anhydrase family protein n=1 Tax=Butyrivibrio sp. VCB2006 TaxID=1280679 RepID=UPI000404F9E6|nr:gamma carbonic anhydrase family protein [Butyrivibrio sp. VCB2006]
MRKIDKSVFIAPGAQVIGDVTIGSDSGIWYNAVIRGDSKEINIGKRTNIQDLAVLHVDKEYKLSVGDNVTIGHSAVVHGCSVGDNVLIGMGAIIMNGAQVGNNCIVGAGALVTENTVIPDGMMAYGNPAKVIRPLEDIDKQRIMENADIYVQHATEAKMGLGRRRAMPL